MKGDIARPDPQSPPWAAGFLVLTILYKVAVSVREETAGMEIEH